MGPCRDLTAGPVDKIAWDVVLAGDRCFMALACRRQVFIALVTVADAKARRAWTHAS